MRSGGGVTGEGVEQASGPSSSPPRRSRHALAPAGVGCLVALLLLAACGGYPVRQGHRQSTSGQLDSIRVSGFRVLAPPGHSYPSGGVASADLAIVNDGRRDELVSASSPDASRVYLMTFGDRQTQVVVEGGGARTEGILLQLTDLRRPVGPTDSLSINLRFRHAGNLTLVVPVQKPGG
jgi:hypothetical protein